MDLYQNFAFMMHLRKASFYFQIKSFVVTGGNQSFPHFGRTIDLPRVMLKTKLLNVISDYELKNVHNADETGLRIAKKSPLQLL